MRRAKDGITLRLSLYPVTADTRKAADFTS